MGLTDGQLDVKLKCCLLCKFEHLINSINKFLHLDRKSVV